MGGKSLPDGLAILSGASGSGKTIFTSQYAYETLVSGGRVIWVTTEELPSTLRAGMSSFGWSTEEYEARETFRIIDAVSAARLGMSENMGNGVLGLDPTGMLIVITEQLRNHDSQNEKLVIIVDSISRLLLSCDQKSVIDFVSCLSSRLENYRTLGIATIAEGAHDERTLNSIIFSSSGTLRFRLNESGEERNRQFRIETMRGRKHDGRWKNYRISDRGFEFEI